MRKLLPPLLVACACSSSPGWSPEPAPDASPAADAGGSDTGPIFSGDAATSCAHSKVTTYGLGPDGTAGTSDDTIISVSDYDFEPGAGDAFTSGSTFRIAHEREGDMDMTWTYTSKGARDRVIQNGKGPDGMFGTADDTIVGINAYQSDSDGFITKNFFHGSAGPNGTWGDSDDVIDQAWRFVRSGDTLTFGVPSVAPGPDGQWATLDDFAQSSIRFRYDSGRVVAREFANGTGLDAQFGTEDDVTFFVMTLPCNHDDIVSQGFDAPGPDGVWRTKDDQLAQYAIETGDRCFRDACGLVVPW